MHGPNPILPARTRILALAALVVALFQATPARADRLIAVVTAARGSVSTREGTQWKSAALMQPMRQGTLLRVGEGASATLGFVQGGVRVYLQGPCEVEVMPSGVRVVTRGTGGQVKRTEPPRRAALRLPPNDSSLDKMGAAPARDEVAGPAWVGVSEAYLAAPTTFGWRPRSTAKWRRFTLTIWKGLDAEVASVEAPGTANSVTLPPTVHLEAGPSYQMQLSGTMADGTQVLSSRRTFRILAGDEAAEIRQARDEAVLEIKANPQDPTPLVLILTRLDAAQLSIEGLEVALRIEKLQGAASPFVAAWLADLRQKLGLQEGPAGVMPELLFQGGHQAPVHGVDFSPDGRLLATGGFDSAARLWEVATGHVVATLMPQGGAVTTVAFSPDRVTLATGTAEGKITLWNVNTGQRVRDLPPHQGSVTCVRFSPDGRIIASGSAEQGLVLCEVASGRVSRRAAHKGLESLAFSPDGRSLAGRVAEERTVIWDLSSGQSRTIVAGYGMGVSYVRNGTLLAMGSVLWDPTSEKVVGDLTTQVNSGHTAFSPDGSLLVVADREKILFIDARSRKVVGTTRRPTGSHALAWSPDGTLLADARVYPSGHVVLRRVPSGEATRTLAARADLVTAVDLDSTARYLLARGAQSRLTLWDLTRGRPIATPPPESETDTLGVPVPPAASHGNPPVIYWTDRIGSSKDGRREVRNRVRRFDLATQTMGDVPSLEGANTVAMKPDGTVLAAGTQDGRVLLLDLTRAGTRPVALDCGQLGPVTNAAFSPDGRSLAVASSRGVLIEMDLASGRPQRPPWDTGLGAPVALRYSPDGRVLAWSCLRSGLTVWRRGEAAPQALPAPVPGTQWTLDFSPDSTLLATVSGRHLNIHDLVKGGPPRALEMDMPGLSIAFVAPRVVAVTGNLSLAAISFRHTDTGALLATAVALDGGKNWVVTTPQGLFDGTADGQRALEWRIGDRLYQLDQFFNDFYTPGLLPRVLAASRESKRMEPALDLSRIKPPPRVLIASPANRSRQGKRALEVRVRVEDQGGGISSPSLYVNGHRVAESSHGVAGRFHVYHVDLAPGENILRATAFNGEGKVESRNDRIVVQADLPPPRVTLHVLAVGVSRYRCGLQVPTAAAGARATSGLFTPGLFADVRTTCLVDGQATRASILAALAEIEKKASPDDAVWVYLGGQAIQSGGDYWYLPWDARAESEEDVQADAISGAQWAEALTRIRATKQVLVLETNADVPSGSLVRLAMRRDAIGAVRAQQRLARSSGTFLVSLSPGGPAPSTAAATETEALGLLMRAIASGLGSGGSPPAASVSREGQVTVNALLRYVGDTVSQASETEGNRRDVVQSGTGQDFPLRLVPVRTTSPRPRS